MLCNIEGISHLQNLPHIIVVKKERERKVEEIEVIPHSFLLHLIIHWDLLNTINLKIDIEGKIKMIYKRKKEKGLTVKILISQVIMNKENI